MKNEIKEIFNKYGKSHYEDDYSLEFETYIVELKELKILFDYITNLQEENEKAIELLNKEYWINEHEHNDKVIDDVLNILQGGDIE